MSLKFAALFSLVLIAVIPTATAQQHADWDMKDAQVASQPISSLPAPDQQGIVKQLGEEKPETLRVMQVQTASGHIFLVQSVDSEWCGAAGNCPFLVLSSDYKILLEKVTQTFKLLSTLHDGLPDIITSMHFSSTEYSLTRWQFNGQRYQRAGCADALYADADGNEFKQPHITPADCSSHRY
jgi:hypothetical protein